ncbi:MAG: hypothetical protein JJU12_00950 [Chlamydiales bacterium]|nr:hypothetical protein [Chlamydiales bacterium]
MKREQKRLFFGLEVDAPWPEALPHGRLIDEGDRHLTLAFLGEVNAEHLKSALEAFPKPSFKVGFAGQFDQCLFLPPSRPRVVAWHLDFMEEETPIKAFYEKLIEWLRNEGYAPNTHHRFNPHVTLARAPFNESVWKRQFTPLPFYLKNIHLYESKGELHYQPIWSFTLVAPLEEISHEADIAYWVRAESYDQLFSHARIALAFSFPAILPFLSKHDGIRDLDDVIIGLNELVARVDQEISCPFKAVSFHSRLEEREEILDWEMIVDV